MSDVTEQAVAAIADLADAMAGIRVLFEQESERYAAERAEEADEKARRQPVRYYEALEQFRNLIRGVVNNASVNPPPDERAFADRILSELEAKLRDAWSVRDTFRTLGVPEPPEDLAAVARKRAESIIGTISSPEELDRWADAFLRGARYHMDG